MILALKSINETVNKIVADNGLLKDDYNGGALPALYRKTLRFFENLFAAQNVTLTNYSESLYEYRINDTVEDLIKPYIIEGKFPPKNTIKKLLEDNDPQMVQILEEFVSENFNYEVRQKIAEDFIDVAKKQTEEILSALVDSIKSTTLGDIQMPGVETIFNDFKYLPDETTRTIVYYCGLSQKTTTILKFLILKEQMEKLLKFIESTRKSFETINNLDKKLNY